MSLPTELCEKIIGDVGDTRSLASCSRACRMFYPIAQRRLFKSLMVCCCPNGSRGWQPNNPTLWTPQFFLETILCGPHIAQYIQELEIWSLMGMSNADAEDLGFLVYLLNNISRISFHPRGKLGLQHRANPRALYDIVADWTSFNPEAEQAMLEIFSKDSIQEIDLSGILNLPIAKFELKRTSPLKTLSVGLVDPTMHASSTESSVGFHVDTLRLYDMGGGEFASQQGWLSHPNCLIDRSSIEQLEIRRLASESYDPDTGPEPVNVIFKNLQNVHHLRIALASDATDSYRMQDGKKGDIGLLDASSYCPPELSLLPNLRTLIFSGPFYSQSPMDYGRFGHDKTIFWSCIDAVPALLRGTVPAIRPSKIEHIKICLGFEVGSGYETIGYIDDPPELSTWSEIVDIMLSPHLPSLRQVKIDIFEIRSRSRLSKQKKAQLLKTIKSHPQMSRLQAHSLLA